MKARFPKSLGHNSSGTLNVSKCLAVPSTHSCNFLHEALVLLGAKRTQPTWSPKIHFIDTWRLVWSLPLKEKRQILDGHRPLAFSVICLILLEQVEGAGIIEHPSAPQDETGQACGSCRSFSSSPGFWALRRLSSDKDFLAQRVPQVQPCWRLIYLLFLVSCGGMQSVLIFLEDAQ